MLSNDQPAVYTGAIPKVRKALSLTKVAKGVQPAPVYVAHFANGDILRMSFWQPPKGPWDFERGRCLCGLTKFAGGREIVDGYVIDKRNGTEHRDPLFDPSAEVTAAKPKRTTAKQYRDALAALINSAQPGPALDRARDLLTA